MSLGGKYVFATVMSLVLLAYVYFDQLYFCVVCVDGLGYVYVSYVVLDQCDATPKYIKLIYIKMIHQNPGKSFFCCKNSCKSSTNHLSFLHW